MLPTLQNLLRIFRPHPTPMPSSSTSAAAARSRATGSCGALVATDGRVLPLRGVELRAEARGGVARVVLSQRFANAYSEPLRVTYRMGLPAEAAVSGYAFELDGRRIVGEVDKKKQARERFERAMLEGKTAGIVEQERTSIFTQELGNVPGGAEIVAELTIDQRLLWRDEGAWEWRFPTTVGARYVGGPGAVPDAERIAVAVAEHGVPARLSMALCVRDPLASGGPAESPSHAIFARSVEGGVELSLGDEGGVALDRDVVVRWPVAAAEVGAALDVGRPSREAASYGLLTVVPPELSRQTLARRDLILLLDTSGSMSGEPLAQLQATALALIDTLTDDDTLEMIEFSSTARRWSRSPRKVDDRARAEATAWIEALAAGGGTEMVTGMIEALAPLSARAQRQVILMTDGYIGNEVDVVKQVVKKLPHGACRVHVVGVGSSVNRTLTRGVARAGGGVEAIIAPGEQPGGVIVDLLARTARPLVTGLAVSGSALLAHAPGHMPDLYAGAPALISLQLRPEGGQIELRGKSAAGPWKTMITVPPCDAGEGSAALAALFGREAVEDLELAHLVASQHERKQIDEAIEAMGLQFQISTRLTTWVAISHDRTVDPTRPSRHEIMPTELPHGVSAEGLGLRSAAGPMAPMGVYGAPVGGARSMAGAMPLSMPPGAMPPPPAMYSMAKPVAPGSSRGFEEEKEEEGEASFAEADDLDDRVLSAPADDISDPKRSEPIDRRNRSHRIERARTELRGGPAKMAMPPAPPAPARKREEPSPANVLARLRQDLGKQLVFELEIVGSFKWSPVPELTLVLADGRAVRATLAPASAQRGTYHAGQVLRLVVDLAATLGSPVATLVVAGTKIPVVG